MAVELPQVDQKVIKTERGEALGMSCRWQGGQYCAIHTGRGLIGCGIYDVDIAGEFNLAVAIARGTPTKPLVYAEDLFEAKIVEVSEPARKMGIVPGMTGLEALDRMLTE